MILGGGHSLQNPGIFHDLHMTGLPGAILSGLRFNLWVLLLIERPLACVCNKI